MYVKLKLFNYSNYIFKLQMNIFSVWAHVQHFISKYTVYLNATFFYHFTHISTVPHISRNRE